MQLASMRHVFEAIGRENIIYCQGCFWLYEDKPWRAVDVLEIKQMIQRLEQDETLNLSSYHVDSVFALIRSECYKADHKFSVSEDLIPVENGVLFQDGEGWSLRPHRREDNFNTCLPIVYDPSAKARRFLQFLEEVFQDEEE